MWPSLASKLSWDITITQVNTALHPSAVAKSSTSFSWGIGEKVTAAGSQVTLCDPIWHVVSSITNCYISLLYFISVVPVSWIKTLRTLSNRLCKQKLFRWCVQMFLASVLVQNAFFLRLNKRVFTFVKLSCQQLQFCGVGLYVCVGTFLIRLPSKHCNQRIENTCATYLWTEKMRSDGYVLI